VYENILLDNNNTMIQPLQRSVTGCKCKETLMTDLLVSFTCFQSRQLFFHCGPNILSKSVNMHH